jgi:hypothetical protein
VALCRVTSLLHPDSSATTSLVMRCFQLPCGGLCCSSGLLRAGSLCLSIAKTRDRTFKLQMSHKVMTVSIDCLKQHLGMASLQAVDPSPRGHPLAARPAAILRGCRQNSVQRMGGPWSSPTDNDRGELFPHRPLVSEATRARVASTDPPHDL